MFLSCFVSCLCRRARLRSFKVLLLSLFCWKRWARKVILNIITKARLFLSIELKWVLLLIEVAIVRHVLVSCRILEARIYLMLIWLLHYLRRALVATFLKYGKFTSHLWVCDLHLVIRILVVLFFLSFTASAKEMTGVFVHMLARVKIITVVVLLVVKHIVAGAWLYSGLSDIGGRLHHGLLLLLRELVEVISGGNGGWAFWAADLIVIWAFFLKLPLLGLCLESTVKEQVSSRCLIELCLALTSTAWRGEESLPIRTRWLTVIINICLSKCGIIFLLINSIWIRVILRLGLWLGMSFVCWLTLSLRWWLPFICIKIV